MRTVYGLKRKDITEAMSLFVLKGKSHYVLLQVGLWIDAGSRYENQRNNGTAHFLEHMAFKVRWLLCSSKF